MSEQIKKMDLFQTTFKSEKDKLDKAASTYEANKRIGSGITTADATKRFRKDLEDAATSILKKDSKMRLHFPFVITDDVIEKLMANPDYYANDGIIEKGSAGLVCENTGEEIKRGELYVQESGTSVVSKLAEISASDRVVVDGESIVIRIAG